MGRPFVHVGVPAADHGGVDSRWIEGVALGDVCGRFPLAGQVPPPPRIAIVGSRAAYHRLQRLVPAFVEVCRRAGWSVVSGGARGIDGAAHRAALDAAVPQLAVLPLGPDRPYPPDHGGLFERIAAAPSSGVLFAQPPGTRPRRGMFASRNRLVVEASSVVLVVQAGRRSGSIQTGRYALRRGRKVVVVTGTPGTAELAQGGALRIHPCGDPSETLARVLAGERPPGHPWPSHLRGLEVLVRGAPDRGISVEDLPDAASVAALCEAEALGLLVEVAPGRYLPA